MMKLKETRKNGFKRHILTRFLFFKILRSNSRNDDLKMSMDLKKPQKYVFGTKIEELKRK